MVSTPRKVTVPPFGKYSFQRRNEGIGNRLRSGGVEHRQASEGMLVLAICMLAVVLLFVEYVYLCMFLIDWGGDSRPHSQLAGSFSTSCVGYYRVGNSLS